MSTAGWAPFFWSAFERSSNPMALFDAGRFLLNVDRAMASTIGYPADQLVGRRADVFLSPDDWVRADADWRHVLRGNRFMNVREVVRADGRRVRVQGAATSAVVSGRQLVPSARRGGEAPARLPASPWQHSQRSRAPSAPSGILGPGGQLRHT